MPDTPAPIPLTDTRGERISTQDATALHALREAMTTADATIIHAAQQDEAGDLLQLNAVAVVDEHTIGILFKRTRSGEWQPRVTLLPENGT